MSCLSLKFLVVLLCTYSFTCFAQVERQAVNLVTSDIDHFWQAYDLLEKEKDEINRLLLLDSLYLKRRSVGLDEFIKQRGLNAEILLASIETNRDRYDSLQAKTNDLDENMDKVLGVYKSYANVYPEFFSPNICFFVGAFRVNATVSNDFSWMLFGTELMIEHINGSSPENFEFIVAHEATHIQQLRHSGFSKELLNRILMEGGADFIAEIVTGIQPYDTDAYRYGKLHEKELWEEFSKRSDKDNGIDYFGSAEGTDRPKRLGYYIGYQICKSYYELSEDKDQAIIDIIEIENPKGFLSLSKYSEKFK